MVNKRLGLLLKVEGLIVVNTAWFLFCKFLVIGGRHNWWVRILDETACDTFGACPCQNDFPFLCDEKQAVLIVRGLNDHTLVNSSILTTLDIRRSSANLRLMSMLRNLLDRSLPVLRCASFVCVGSFLQLI